MSIDLDRQLREYCRQLDEKQGALTFEDILERTGELQVIPGRGNQQVTRRRKWFAAAALVVSLVAIFHLSSQVATRIPVISISK